MIIAVYELNGKVLKTTNLTKKLKKVKPDKILYQTEFTGSTKDAEKILDDWLEQQSTIAPEVTNWRLICISWETGNGNKYIPKNPVKPNYRNMENMIN